MMAPRAIQIRALTRPSRIRLSRSYAAPAPAARRRSQDESTTSGIKRLEAEDARLARELAKSYKAQGMDVRGALPVQGMGCEDAEQSCD